MSIGKDTRYLIFKNGSWHFYYTIPKRLKTFFNKHRIKNTLNTADLKVAIQIRDRYLMPLVSSETAIDILENTLFSLDRAKVDLDKGFENLNEFLNRKKEDSSIGITLSSLCDFFLKSYKMGGFSPASISKIESVINSACAILSGNVIADDISKAEISHFRDVLLTLPVGWLKRSKISGHFNLAAATANERSMHPNTVQKELETLKRIFAWGIDEGKLKRLDNPVDKIKVIGSGKKKHKRPPSGEEVDLLCNMKMTSSTKFNQEAWEFLPIFARYTACRIGEIALLTGNDIIVKNDVKCLNITAHGENKQLKTESSERLVPVSDKLEPYLNKLFKKHSSGSLFPACGHWYGENGKIRKPAHYFLKAYNCNAKKIADDLSVHCWRVYANTQMANAGVDILDREAILGHKSSKVQSVYTAENLHRLKKAIDTIY